MRHLLALVCVLLAGQIVCAQGGDFEYVESGVTLRMSAPAQPNGGRKFILAIQTNDVYECSGTIVENDVRLEGNKLLIKVKGVRIPDPCTPLMGPALARIDLTALKPGKYKVRTTINRQVFKSNLVIAEDHIDFDIPSEDPTLFRIYNGRLNIIPANSIWGTVVYAETAQKGEALKFMKDLQAAGATLTQLPPGNYDEFYLHQVGTTQEKVVSSERIEYPFVYTYTGDFAALEPVMDAYRGKLKITLRNSSGGESRNF